MVSLKGYSEAKIAAAIQRDVNANNKKIAADNKKRKKKKRRIVFIHLSDCEKICPCGTYKVYAKWGWMKLYDPLKGMTDRLPDFHFYRQHRDGTWSHKPGHGKVETGVKDPREHNYELNTDAKKGKYDKFGGCFCISNSGMDVK